MIIKKNTKIIGFDLIVINLVLVSGPFIPQALNFIC